MEKEGDVEKLQQKCVMQRSWQWLV